jgi:uncharacterized LabA/DUF88 family protein
LKQFFYILIEYICIINFEQVQRYFYVYTQYGEVSPKLDVYAFVDLFELISSKQAIVRTNEPKSELSNQKD